jgi:hypothetical protein
MAMYTNPLAAAAAITGFIARNHGWQTTAC